MLIVVCTVVVLHERGITVVEVYDTVGKEVFLIVEVDLLRGDTWRIMLGCMRGWRSSSWALD